MKPSYFFGELALIFLLHIIPVSFASAQTVYSIDFRSGKFTPEEKEIPVGQTDVFGGRRYGLIQFFALPDDAEKDKLKRQGVELLDYLPQNAWCFSAPALMELKKLSGNIRAVFPLQPDYKMEAGMRSGQFPSWAVKESGKLDFVIQTFRKEDAGRADIHQLLQSKGATILDFHPEFQTIVLRAPGSILLELAKEAWVQWMEPVNPEAKSENLPGKNLHRSTTLEYGIRNLTGSGVKVAIWDGGEVGTHKDFESRLTLVETSAADDHASHVMGTIGGAGVLNPTARGMAPGATLFSYNYFGDVAAEMQAQQPVRGFTIASHSWGFGDSYAVSNCASGDPYNSTSRSQDLVLVNYPNLLHVHSSGNSQAASGCGGWRTTTGKAAKNTLVVGNAVINETISSSSSTGPVQDGRLKPEISALGTNVFSTTPNNSYMTMSGTSMATPGVSGVMAQLVQRYRQLNSNADPISSLLKALVCNTARDRGTAGPDYRFGYGIINGLKSVTAMEENRFEVNSISNGGSYTKTIAVPAGIAQIRVMITWLDPAGSANANPALINNLNLTVTDPSSAIFNPWILDPALPANAAVRGVDNRNNIEQVTISNPAAGNYTVTINGASVPSGPQQYALTWEFDINGIQILYPNGGEVLQPGTNAGTVFWDSFGVTGNQTIEYSTNNGSTWVNLGTVASTVNNVSWTVPSTVSNQYLMRITQGSLTDQSDANFSVIGTPAGLAFAQGCNAGDLNISWNTVTGATQYDVMKLDTVTATWSVYAGNLSATSHLATGLSTSQRHYFAVRAKTASVTGLRCTAVITSGEHSMPFSVTALADAGSGCAPLNTTLRAIGPATTYTSGSATFSTISGTPTNITTWTGDADDGFAQVSLPFSFKFYNTDYNSVFISTNGFVTFGAGSAANTPNAFPSASAPNNVVALCFSDLNLTSAGTCGYFSSGVAPNRRFVIQYSNVPPFSGTGTLSGQLVLFEGSNIIEMHLSNQNLSILKTQGLENSNGTAATPISGRNNANWTATNDGRRFSPTLPATYVWSPATGLSNTSVQYPTITASASGSYTVSVSYSGCNSSSTVNLSVQDVPGQPGIISGSASVCSGASRTFSIASVSEATSYSWTLPSGWTGTSATTSINTTTGSTSGNISVSGVNACGTGTARSLAVTAFSSVPAQPGSITGSASVCIANSQSYSIAAVSGAESYSWSLPSGWSGTSATNSISTTTGANSGNISVSAVNACGTGTARSLAVTAFSAVPAQPGSISGPASVCLNGDPNVYTVPVLSGASSYSWSLPLGWTGASTSNSISTNAPVTSGNVTVSGVNACGTGISRSLSVTAFTSLPAQPSVISATSSICSGSSQNYSIPAMTGVESYHWSFPSGFSPASSSGADLTLLSSTAGSSSGTVSVYASNACGNGTARDFIISISNIPATPGSISGDATVCNETINAYSVSAVPEATSYSWTLPSGWSGSSSAASINANAGPAGGLISVRAENFCGSSASQSISVTSVSIPAQPTAISGPSEVCASSTEIYSVASVAGATSYIWTLPSGWSGSSSTPSISATASTISGQITVKASNSCGSGTTSGLTVNPVSIPAQPGSISGSTTGTAGLGSMYSITSVPAATSYFWTLPAGWTGSSASSSIIVTPNSVSGSISVAAQNFCGTGPARSLFITSTDPGTGLELNNWLGLFDTPSGNNWLNPANWSASNGVPTSAQLARVPAGTPFSPKITGIQPAGAVQIETGADIHLGESSARLQVAGNLVGSSGQFTGDGSIELVGNQNQVLSGNLAIQNLSIQKSGGSLQIGGTVRIKGLMQFVNSNASLSVQPGSDLIFHSDENGTGKLGPVPDGLVISGNITTERKLNYPGASTGNWFFMGSAISGRNFSDWADDFSVSAPGAPYFGVQPGVQPAPNFSNTTIFKYMESLHNIKTDEVQKIGWRIPGNENIEPGRGYRVWVNRYSNSSGKFDNRGDLVYGAFTFPSLTRNHFSPCYPIDPDHPSDACNVDQRGWNLLANPYPCDLNWDGPGWVKPAGTEMGNAFYIWNNPGAGYGFYGSGSYLGVTPAPANPWIIPSGQAFFVRINNPGSQTLQVNESAKITSASGQFLRTATQEGMHLKVHLSKDGTESAYGFSGELRFNPQASDSFDPGLDFSSLGGNQFHFSFPLDNEKCILNQLGELNEVKFVPIEMNYQGETGTFYFSFSGLESFEGHASVYLKDKQLQTITPILSEAGHAFDVTGNSSASDRFELVFTPLLTQTGKMDLKSELRLIPNPASEFSTLIFSPENGEIRMEIFDETGKQVNQKVFDGSRGQANLDLRELPSGIYLLKLIGKSAPKITRLVKLSK